jgi:hypothetical protein
MATGWSRSGMLSMKSALERRRVDGVLCLPEPPSKLSRSAALCRPPLEDRAIVSSEQTGMMYERAGEAETAASAIRCDSCGTEGPDG